MVLTLEPGRATIHPRLTLLVILVVMSGCSPTHPYELFEESGQVFGIYGVLVTAHSCQMRLISLFYDHFVWLQVVRCTG